LGVKQGKSGSKAERSRYSSTNPIEKEGSEEEMQAERYSIYVPFEARSFAFL